MVVLDSLNGATFLKMSGYDFTWNPQNQTVEFFNASRTSVTETITGIDGVGRQSFSIPVTETAVISGWVDVDMVHNRIVVVMGSEEAVIDLVTDGTTNAVFPGAIARRSCVCMSGGVRIAGCGFQWCRNARVCRGNTATGNCFWTNVDDPEIAPGPG